MADIRIKDLATTASSAASDDFMALDGATNGTRKMSAANPSVTTLTTSGVIAPGGSVHGANGSAANPSFAFNSDQNTGLYRIGAGNIGVTANGNKVLDIATTGLTVTGAITATTTLADQGGTISAQRNGLAPRQALVQDGTLASTTSVAALGSTDFTLGGWVRQTAAATAGLIAGNASSIALYILSNGTLRADKLGAGSNTASTGTVPVGNDSFVLYVRSGATGTYYINGIAAGTSSDAFNYSTAIGFIGGDTASTNVLNGKIIPVVYNRALSAAEVLALYQSGAPAGADYPTTVAGTDYVVNGNFSSSTGWNVGTAWTIAAGVATTNGTGDGGGASELNQNGKSFKAGQRVRVTYTLAGVSSGSFRIIFYGGTSNVFTTARTANGTYTEEVTLTGGATTYQTTSNGSPLNNGATLDNISVVSLGLLLAPDSNNAGAGLEWLDVSGNRAHIVLPTSGVTWSLPSSQQIVIEASTSTNGNQQLGGASLIDANKQWRIQSWTVNCSTGTPTISLGNVSAGAQFVSGAVMASGNNDITLVTRFPSTANLWVNSNSTATLIHRITLVPAN